jgi:hypothetical protein
LAIVTPRRQERPVSSAFRVPCQYEEVLYSRVRLPSAFACTAHLLCASSHIKIRKRYSVLYGSTDLKRAFFPIVRLPPQDAVLTFCRLPKLCSGMKKYVSSWLDHFVKPRKRDESGGDSASGPLRAGNNASVDSTGKQTTSGLPGEREEATAQLPSGRRNRLIRSLRVFSRNRADELSKSIGRSRERTRAGVGKMFAVAHDRHQIPQELDSVQVTRSVYAGNDVHGCKDEVALLKTGPSVRGRVVTSGVGGARGDVLDENCDSVSVVPGPRLYETGGHSARVSTSVHAAGYPSLPPVLPETEPPAAATAAGLRRAGVGVVERTSARGQAGPGSSKSAVAAGGKSSARHESMRVPPSQVLAIFRTFVIKIHEESNNGHFQHENQSNSETLSI